MFWLLHETGPADSALPAETPPCTGLNPQEVKMRSLGSDKILRLYAQTAEFESGHVLLPRSAPWRDAYMRELTTFPGSKYDDQVDSTTTSP